MFRLGRVALRVATLLTDQRPARWRWCRGLAQMEPCAQQFPRAA